MSSEALEAIRRRHAAPTSGPWDTSRGTLSGYIVQARADVLALLTEVARLEQERTQLVGELQSAEEGEQRYWAALAVARDREQRVHVGYLREIDAIAERYERREEIMREALQRIADENYLRGSNDGWEGMCARQGRLARAALVDEPAAAGAAVPGRYQGGTDGEDSASAAADEPGETP